MKGFELLSKEIKFKKEAFKNIQKATRSAESLKEQRIINWEWSEKKNQSKKVKWIVSNRGGHRGP